MNRDFDWMWSEACDQLVRAERLHRQFFQPRHSGTWEPPVDILETEREV
ncbi:MAG: Hsp20/alpha crystallin family protein, partial [Xanthobacteraceae bacterium]